VCSLHGDPHLQPFAGLPFDMQSLGSGDKTAVWQAIKGPWGPESVMIEMSTQCKQVHGDGPMRPDNNLGGVEAKVLVGVAIAIIIDGNNILTSYVDQAWKWDERNNKKEKLFNHCPSLNGREIKGTVNVGAATIQCLAQSGFSYRGDKLNVDFSWGDYGSFTASLKNGANAQDNEGICGGRNMKSWENRGLLPCDDCRRYDLLRRSLAHVEHTR